ncbi:unnamed protein product [Musa acuminata subsp. malaccensis]|uniref:(wild Malaysian banana) hypothetical protein n=1 Tax=Musa acuminata subsp. malaccensis TaxID=214687 RepID=A0A8D7FIJ2_MUSAM|nr:unnamed protein product [Musa acuminata subsp. malaccensis]
MALKFLNKKGWHTGSLRNIENVWKAEQKHEAEQRKLEELRKQIQDEREKSEFRLLQEQAGLVPRQERLDFLYESGLAVGKGSSDGFKALQAPPAAASTTSTSEASSTKAAVPGALFEDKPQSANDTWRKLHSDPLLLIRQREQEALARIKNNPIKMAMIQKSVSGFLQLSDLKILLDSFIKLHLPVLGFVLMRLPKSPQFAQMMASCGQKPFHPFSSMPLFDRLTFFMNHCSLFPYQAVSKLNLPSQRINIL